MTTENSITAPEQAAEKIAIKDDLAVHSLAPSLHDAEQLKTAVGADEAQQYVGAEVIEVAEEDSRRILKKIDWHLLPIMCGLYCMQYIDKVLLSFASAMGIQKDIHLNPDEYAWAGSIFYGGYLVFAYPHNRLLQRLPVAKYMAVAVMIWGAILCFSALVKNAAGLLISRFFLGAMEGSVTAGFVLVTASWYRAEEQTFRTALWFGSNGFAQIFGGIIAFGCVSGDEKNRLSIYTWQLLFLVVGAFTFLYGVMMWFCFADSPVKASWLSPDEKRLAIERLRSNQQGIGSRKFKWYQVKEAFTDIRTYIIFLSTVTQNIPNGGVTVFFTALIQSYGFTTKETFLLSTPAGLVQIITNFGIPYVAQRYRNRMAGAVVGILICLFGISLMAGLAMDNHPLRAKAGQLIGYYLLIATTAAPMILILSVIATNTLGSTKKTTVNATSLVGYCIGFLIGPQCFRDPPYYYVAKYNIIGMWIISLLCYIALYFVNRRENAKRDREWREAGCPVQPPGQEFMDLTDRENRFFRYAL